MPSVYGFRHLLGRAWFAVVVGSFPACKWTVLESAV